MPYTSVQYNEPIRSLADHDFTLRCIQLARGRWMVPLMFGLFLHSFVYAIVLYACNLSYVRTLILRVLTLIIIGACGNAC